MSEAGTIISDLHDKIESLATERDDLKTKLALFEEAMEKEKKPDWSKSLKDCADCLERGVLTKEIRDIAANQLRYMADSFTLKANFVPRDLRIKELEAKLAQVEADAAAMRERMKELEHSDQMWDEHMSPFTDYEGDEAPWKTMAREFETLRATAQRRLELLREVEGPVSDVVAFGNCDCDIPNGKTCLTCQLALSHKALAAELKEPK